MTINISELQKIIYDVMKQYMEFNSEEINTNEDNYWFIDMEDALDFTNQPTSMCVGSLEDDYGSLMEILSLNRKANILDMDRIANIFKILSYEIEKQKDIIL